jgi:hypothetical protein
MAKCSICGWRVGNIKCRRCGRIICRECYTSHGLCRECFNSLIRVKKGAIRG